MRLAWLLAVALALPAVPAQASSTGTWHSHSRHHHSTNGSHKKCTTCTRDSHGRIVRSERAKGDFMRQTGHPHGWVGHVVDHRLALECGGRDVPANMQWQTTAEAKAKDRTERTCR